MAACACWSPLDPPICRGSVKSPSTADRSPSRFALSVFSGFLFGSIPAYKYARTRAAAALSGASRTASASRDRQRSRSVLVVAQVAMALVLLISALLMIRTFAALRNVDPGFSDPAHLETMRIYIPDLLVTDPVQVTRMQNEIVDKIAAIPGVTSVGFSGGLPMEGIDPNWDEMGVEGKHYDRWRASAAPVQLCLPRILPDSRHSHRRRSRLHVERHLQSSTSTSWFLRISRAKTGARLQPPSASVSASSPQCPGKWSSALFRMCATTAWMKRRRPSSIGPP